MTEVNAKAAAHRAALERLAAELDVPPEVLDLAHQGHFHWTAAAEALYPPMPPDVAAMMALGPQGMYPDAYPGGV